MDLCPLPPMRVPVSYPPSPPHCKGGCFDTLM